MQVRPAERVYRTWILDSRRWDHYLPRPDDIVISTYPKCGTTWMQRIVGLLVFRDPEPRPIMEISPWMERRFPEPIKSVIARIDAQTHRRFLKTHLPCDGLPLHDDVKYIHVARDGRDACMSFHNHATGFTTQMLEALDRQGLEDETVARPYPRIPTSPADQFHDWLTRGVVPGQEDGQPTISFFHFERSWWIVRDWPNVLLVHYNDLKSDLPGEMRRIADFLGIAIVPELFSRLAAAAGFQAMRQDGAVLMGSMASAFQGGSDRFFHKGENERWRGVYRDNDLALYDTKLKSILPTGCGEWVQHGRWRGILAKSAEFTP